MSQESKAKIVERLRADSSSASPDSDLKVIYRIDGGIPSERVTEEFTLSHANQVKVSRQNMLKTGVLQESEGKLELGELQQVLEELASSINSLFARDEAQFVPDSMVGSLSVEFDGVSETFYFLADEQQGRAQNKSLAMPAKQAFARIKTISDRLLQQESRDDE